MRNHAERCLVALTEESWRGQADNQVLAHKHTRHHPSGFAVVCHRANCRSPSCKRIGEVELDASMSVQTSTHIGIPIRRIWKSLSHLGHNQVRTWLHLRQARMVKPRRLRQQRALQSGFPREEEGERRLWIEFDIALRIELRNDVPAFIRTHRVQRLINFTKTQVCLY